MGRKSVIKQRKPITKRVNAWLAALLIVLQDKRLEQLTIDDIANLANKSKSTIYEYFESKEDILLAACQTRIKFLSDSMPNEAEQKGNPIERYEYLIVVFTEGLAGISTSFLQEIKLHYPSSWEAINTLTNTFIEIIKVIYQEGMEQGYYHTTSINLLANLDRYFVTEMVTNPTIFADETYTLSDLVRDYLKLRLTGLVKNKNA